MEYRVYKLKFHTAVHFGNGRLSSTESALKADTLFSAMCIEAGKVGKLEELYQYAQSGQLKITDTMPYIDGELQLPKPLLTMEWKEDGNSVLKKRLKKLKYIPVGDFSSFLKGEIHYITEKDEKTKKLGQSKSMTKAAIYGLAETMPYHVGSFRFTEGCGLYFLAATETKASLSLLDELMQALSLVGLGGKRSSGFGKFSFTTETLPPEIQERLKNLEKYKVYMTLSGAMAKMEELSDCLENANYLLEKRSGFIFSDQVLGSVKKQDLHVFAAGSCFTHLFVGDIFDVSNGSSHAVYRYAKPFFMGVSYE
ncbi:type III-A CRISPR-associated RAMP protein Csm4 [Clostridiales bacterium COT073_COT-073]|nr:type III-A CRISPR-associated RAMP protein Csm4 [Clostridiales bacterium COT073_COT-073]